MKNAILPVVLTILCHTPLAEAAVQLKAAAAVCDVTPPTGFAMWGYAARKDAPSVGVADRLRARAVVLEVASERLAIVSLDLGRAPTRTHMRLIREGVRKVGVNHVMLVASHTHHGPVLEIDSWPNVDTPYTGQLDDKLVEVIARATRDLTSARWGTASREVPLNRNRHSNRPDSPVDRALTVMRVESLDGRPIAHLVNFAAHPTMIDAKDHRLSADFPGALAALVEQATGAPCLFLQGAAGDLSPRAPDGVRGHVEFGQAVGREVLDVATTIRCSESSRPTLAATDDEFTFKSRLDVSNGLVKAALGRAFFPDLIAFYEREYRDGVRPHLTVAVLDGKVGFVGVSGEIFCGHAISLRRRARLEHLLFCGYCNDYQQYFPTIEAATEGGYGTTPPVGMGELGAGERVTDRALLHLYRLRGMLSE